MLTSRMFTTAFRFFAAVSAFGVVAALAVGIASGSNGLVDRVLGPLTMGWKGGVGNHFAYALLLGLAVVAGTVAGVLVAFRDADPAAQAQLVHTDAPPAVDEPKGVNYLPSLAALSFTMLLIGLGTDTTWMNWSAVGVLLAVAFVWTLRTWAEHATGDDHANATLYHRFIDPLRVPVISIIAVAIVALGFSRVLLAVSKTASVWVFGLVALVIFLVCVLLALKPASAKWVTTALVVLAAIAMIAAGIAATIAGEREIEHHSSTGATSVAAVVIEVGSSS